MDESDNPEECKVCISHYDKAKRRPRTLPCGHTFCTLCITGMIKEEKDELGLSCPTCRLHHQATDPVQFPISYDMEAIIRKLKILQITSMNKGTQGQGGSIEVQERDGNIKLLIASLKETIGQLERYESQLNDWKQEHEDIIAKLQELETRNRTALKQLEDERSILLYQRKRGQESMKQLETIEGCLNSASNPQEAVSALDKSESSCSEVEDWLQHCRAIFPDQATLQSSLEVRECSGCVLEGGPGRRTKAYPSTKQLIPNIMEKVRKSTRCVLEGAAASVISEEPPTTDPPDPTSTIMEKVDLITPTLSVESLGRLGGSVEALVGSGRVVGVMVRDNKGGPPTQHARLTLYQGRPHLHALTPQPPPPGAHLMQHDALIASLNPSSTLAFLDLGWMGPGEVKGRSKRVYIRLAPDTELARHFRLLCTGEEGPSYLHSKILGVWNKGTEFEVVGGGDYERDDGQGGALLTGELRPRQEYQRLATAGTVRAMHGAAVAKGAQFSISTRDCPSREWHWAFGQVESGLEVIRAVAAYKRIREVKVLDCGVVLDI